MQDLIEFIESDFPHANHVRKLNRNLRPPSEATLKRASFSDRHATSVASPLD